jgi:hypothetical protein
MIYHCEECGFITHLKNNYTRHLSSKKHFFMTDTKPTKEDLEKQAKVVSRNKKDYSKMRTPDYIKKANKKRRDEYKKDEAHRDNILNQCKETYEKHKEKYNIRNKQYNEDNWWVSCISGSKYNDKKYERYDKKNYIDKDFLLNQREEQNNKCIYCECLMNNRGKTRTKKTLTIERKDNDLGHNKDNCVLACWGCNRKRHKLYTFEEFKLLNI